MRISGILELYKLNPDYVEADMYRCRPIISKTKLAILYKLNKLGGSDTAMKHLWNDDHKY